MKLIPLIFILVHTYFVHGQIPAEDSLRNEIQKTKNDTSRIKLYLELHDLVRLTDFNKAAEIAKESYQLALTSGWEEGIAKTGRNLGIAYSLLGESDSAILVLDNALKSSLVINDSANIGYIYMTLGNIQYDQTNYDEALKYYFMCLETYETIDNYAGMSSALIWIGIIYQYAKSDFTSAIETYKEAERNADLGNSTLNKAYIYGNLATIYNDQGEYDSALTYYKKSNVIKRSFGDQRGIGNDYNNIGNVWYELKKYDSALSNYEKGLAIRREMKDQTGVASSLINIGRCHLDLANNLKASRYLTEGYEVAQKVNYKEAWQQAAIFLSQLHESTKDYKRSLTYYKEYKAISDSIFNAERDRNITELQTQYDTEKKEQQIALQEAQLSEQKAELDRNRYLTIALIVTVLSVVGLGLLNRSRLKKKQQLLLQEEKIHIKEAEINASISSQEKERARYARDLHDGFGQMISILNMNLGSLRKDAKPEERQQVFEESEKVINEMYNELKGICFDLMPQTLVSNGLQSGLQEFAERINKAGEVFVETHFFGLDDRLSELQEISIYRITQEWINNILKYSDANKITLQVTRDESELTLLIEDDGQGFDQTLLTASKGNGWKNLNSRTNLIRGRIDLETEVGMKGNTFIVNAPTVESKVDEEVAVLS